MYAVLCCFHHALLSKASSKARPDSGARELAFPCCEWRHEELQLCGKQRVELCLFQSTTALQVFLTKNIIQMLVKNRLLLIISVEVIEEH